MTAKKAVQRSLFHRVGGGIDFSRLIEQAIPLILVAAISSAVTIYANSGISASQVANLKEHVSHSDDERKQSQSQTQMQIQSILVELAKGQSLMVASFGQQTILNAQMDARLTYIERSQSRPPGIVIESQAVPRTNGKR